MDESAFVAEVTQMRDMLYRLSVSYLGCDADAQDAVQQALENAWRHRDRVKPDAFRHHDQRMQIPAPAQAERDAQRQA